MCLIAYQPYSKTDKAIPYEFFQNAHCKNSDGMGLMYAKNEKIHIIKQMNNVDKFYGKYLKALEEEETVVVHFRLGTSGSKTLANVHPFFVNERLAMCHNGVLYGEDIRNDMSDTRAFIEDKIKALPDAWMTNPHLVDLIEKYIGGDKIVWLDNLGNSNILNSRNGHWYNDYFWFSNHSYNGWATSRTTDYQVTKHSEKRSSYEGKIWDYKTHSWTDEDDLGKDWQSETSLNSQEEDSSTEEIPDWIDADDPYFVMAGGDVFCLRCCPEEALSYAQEVRGLPSIIAACTKCGVTDNAE